MVTRTENSANVVARQNKFDDTSVPNRGGEAALWESSNL